MEGKPRRVYSRRMLRKVYRTVVLAVVIFLALAAVAMGLFRANTRYELNDKTRVAYFRERQQGFETVAAMLEQESPNIRGFTPTEIILNKAAPTWVSPEEAGMNPEQFLQIQQMMRQHDIDRIWRYEGELVIVSGYWGWGFLSKGPRLAYVKLADEPSGMLESLDDFRRSKKGWVTSYRRLGDDWYIRLTW